MEGTGSGSPLPRVRCGCEGRAGERRGTVMDAGPCGGCAGAATPVLLSAASACTALDARLTTDACVPIDLRFAPCWLHCTRDGNSPPVWVQMWFGVSPTKKLSGTCVPSDWQHRVPRCDARGRRASDAAVGRASDVWPRGPPATVVLRVRCNCEGRSRLAGKWSSVSAASTAVVLPVSPSPKRPAASEGSPW